MNSNCNGKTLPASIPICCPPNFYIRDNTGCTYCNGNIFIFIDIQVCCPTGYSFDSVTGKCSYCDGILDASLQLCCSYGSYVRYDTAGNARCDSSCSTDNIYKASYCCDGLTAGCSATYSPTTCNPSYYISNSCTGCPGFCSSNSNLCSSSFSAANCNQICRATQIFVQRMGCL